jgi:hypothetical protein
MSQAAFRRKRAAPDNTRVVLGAVLYRLDRYKEAGAATEKMGGFRHDLGGINLATRRVSGQCGGRAGIRRIPNSPLITASGIWELHISGCRVSAAVSYRAAGWLRRSASWIKTTRRCSRTWRIAWPSSGIDHVAPGSALSSSRATAMSPDGSGDPRGACDRDAALHYLDKALRRLFA